MNRQRHEPVAAAQPARLPDEHTHLPPQRAGLQRGNVRPVADLGEIRTVPILGRIS